MDMSKPGSRLAQPLDYAERRELSRLRQCKLCVPATFASEREELAALSAELEREIAEVLALTKKDSPLTNAVEPVAELTEQRQLVCVLRKRWLCRCGCRGWCSLLPALNVPPLSVSLGAPRCPSAE